MLLIIGILEEILAPPRMANIGFSPLFMTLSIDFTSFSKRLPKNLFSKNCAIIVVDACALCAVPKASLT